MALVRDIWPEINAALKAGHRLTVVHKRLATGGCHIAYRTLASCVNRIRLEQARTPRSRTVPVKTTVETRAQPARLGQDRPDPLANLEKYGTGSLPGFHFTGDLPDPDKLF
jgi:hypothetical protein